MVQKGGPKALSIWEWSAVTNERLAGNEASKIGGKQATDCEPSRPARLIGVSPMRSSIRLEGSTMESSRSTQSHHRGLSDSRIDPIKGPGCCRYLDGLLK